MVNVKNYHPEIDGLRAIAVLSVLFFHAGFDWAKGGFVGVDIFFVISGYLITSNIISGANKNTFTLKDFYIRRFRRLLPALFFTIFTSWIAGYYLIQPVEFERLGKVVLASVFSLSNFFFWSEANYFDGHSEYKPLLHTWSLSVEEQFYLLWPSLILLLLRSKSNYFFWLSILCIGIVSFISSIQLSLSQASLAFYLLPTRIFEFTLGALLIPLKKSIPPNKVFMELFAIFGIGLIFYSILTIDQTAAFPGYIAILPCLGCFFIILSGNGSFISKIISIKPIIFIGLISYSVYLAHWPIMVYYKIWKFSALTIVEQHALSLASIIAGFLMWRFIETPFRHKKDKEKNDTNFLKGLALSLVILIACAIVSITGDGLPDRFSTEYYMTKEEIIAERSRYWNELKGKNSPILAGSNHKQEVIIIGNSHAVDLVYALRTNGYESTIKFLTTSGCFNFHIPIDQKRAQQCTENSSKSLTSKHLKQAAVVFLHEDFFNNQPSQLLKILNQVRSKTEAPIYLFGPKMIFSKDIPDIVTHHSEEFMKINTVASQYSRKEQRIKINEEIKQIFTTQPLEKNNIFFIDVLTTQCGKNADNCNIVSPSTKKSLYFDQDHFTLQGAKEFGESLKANYPEVFSE